MGDKTSFARAETIPDAPYLTPGKRYPVVSESGGLFTILDDEGDEICCRWSLCAHLDGGDWERS